MDALFGIVGPVPPRRWHETRLVFSTILEHACADLGQKGISMLAITEANPHVPTICARYPAHANWNLAVSEEWRLLKRTNAIITAIHGPVAPEEASTQELPQNRPVTSLDGRLVAVYTSDDDATTPAIPVGSIRVSSSVAAEAVLRLAEKAQNPMAGLAVALEAYSGVFAVAVVDLKERVIWTGHTGVESMLLVRLDTRVLITTHPKSILEGYAWTVGVDRLPTEPENIIHVALRKVIGVNVDTGRIILPD